MADKVTFEIVKEIAVLREPNDNGWTREVNLVSWNGADAKVDIRDWSPDHSKMSKGITLTVNEGKALAKYLQIALN